MPFLDSKIIRALYDIEKGGPPEAFRCVVQIESVQGFGTLKDCGEVFKSLSMVTAHIEHEHKLPLQLEIFPDAKRTTE